MISRLQQQSVLLTESYAQIETKEEKIFLFFITHHVTIIELFSVSVDNYFDMKTTFVTQLSDSNNLFAKHHLRNDTSFSA